VMTAVGEPNTPSADASHAGSTVEESRAGWGYGFLFALGYAPLLGLFFLNLWRRPHYQFFPLAILGAAFLAWARLREMRRPLVPGGRGVGWIFLAGSLLLLLLATVSWSPWLGSLAALTGVAGVAWWRGGGRLLAAMLPALVLLLTIIPPPLSADSLLIQQMRVLAVNGSSSVLDSLGVTHALSGNVIEIPGQRLLVDEACSGINSVLVILACALFYGMWRRRSLIHIFLSVVNALGFVLLGNLARITLGAWLMFRHGVDILTGTAHQLTGLLLFPTYIGIILSMDQLLAYLFSPSRRRRRSPEPPAAAEDARASRVPLGIPRGWVRATGCAFALLGVVNLGLALVKHKQLEAQAVQPKPALRADASFSMPDQIGGWKRMGTEVPPLQKVETVGVRSQIWHYRLGDTLVSLALDYPFRGYHHLEGCYAFSGWDVMERRTGGGVETNDSPPFVEVRMQNNLGMHASLWFSLVDERSRWLTGPAFKPTLKERLLQRMQLNSLSDSVSYQIQVLSTGFNPLRPTEREQVRRFFEEGRRIIWRQLFDQIQPKT